MILCISQLISQDALPFRQALSSDQYDIKRYLARILKADDLELSDFLDRVIRALLLFGDCTGLGHLCRDGGGTILARWLRCEIALSTHTFPDSRRTISLANSLVDQIDFAILSLRKDDRWSCLFHEPCPSKNRLVSFQLEISGFPAYHLVAAKLHRGICAKTKQLRHLDTVTFNDRLGGFVRSLIRVVEGIPAEYIRKSLWDYDEGKLDAIIQKVILSLPRWQFGIDGRTTYAPTTLRKFYTTWLSAFYGIAAKKPYITKKNSPRYKGSFDPVDSA